MAGYLCASERAIFTGPKDSSDDPAFGVRYCCVFARRVIGSELIDLVRRWWHFLVWAADGVTAGLGGTDHKGDSAKVSFARGHFYVCVNS